MGESSPLTLDAPTVSFTIATFNSSRKIGDCLESIRQQDYPKSKVEVIVADGGSTDATLQICRRYGATIVSNPKKTEKGFTGGKTLALSHANNEIVIVLDSDNVLSDNQYVRNITKPFVDPMVIAVSPLIAADPRWGSFERYAATVYDPFDYGWTRTAEERTLRFALGQEYVEIVCGESEKVYLGNGSAVRRRIYSKVGGYDYDLETGKRLYREGKIILSTKTVVFHRNALSVRELIRKRVRQIDELVLQGFARDQPGGFYSIVLPHDRPGLLRLATQVIGNLTVIYPFLVSLRGYHETGDSAFAWHPVLAPIVTLTYGYGVLSRKAGRQFIMKLARDGLGN